MKQGKEFSVGLFAIIGFVLFAVFVFSIGKFKGPSREITVEFGYVDGLGAAAPVQYAGYKVGEVKSVKILPGPPVKLLAKLSVPKDLPVTHTTEVSIGSMGLMGEKVIEILPSGEGAPLAEGEILRGTDPILLSRIFGQVRSMFDESTSNNIRQVAANVLKLTEDLNVFTSTLRKLSTENGEDIHKIITNTAESSDHLPGLMKSAESAAQRIDKAATSLTTLAENLKGMSADNRPEIQEMVKNLTATSANLKALSDDVRRHPWKLIRKSDGEAPKKPEAGSRKSE